MTYYVQVSLTMYLITENVQVDFLCMKYCLNDFTFKGKEEPM